MSDILQVALIVLTGFTVKFLCRYTNETIELRIATQNQVTATNLLLEEERRQTEIARNEIEVTNKVLEQAAIQNRQNLMPVVVMSTGRNVHGADSFNWNNMGKGSALNVRTTALRLNDKPEGVDFFHRRAIAPGDKEFGHSYNAGKETQPNEVLRLMNYDGNAKEAVITVSYSGSDRRRFETRHKLRPSGTVLDIEFMSFDVIA
jgi:hypothetical protein